MIAARSEALLADFVVLFLIRWALNHAGLDYVYCQPVLSETAPPLALADFHYPGSAIFYGTMYFVSGLPELILAGMWVIYSVVALSVFGRTLGMRQAGTKLVSANGGEPGFARIVLRQLVAPVSSILWIGYWPAGFTRNAETLHDLISGTRVVFMEKVQQPEA
jgi:uncharacterized RDD family membrane protein YckC